MHTLALLWGLPPRVGGRELWAESSYARNQLLICVESSREKQQEYKEKILSFSSRISIYLLGSHEESKERQECLSRIKKRKWICLPHVCFWSHGFECPLQSSMLSNSTLAMCSDVQYVASHLYWKSFWGHMDVVQWLESLLRMHGALSSIPSPTKYNKLNHISDTYINQKYKQALT